MSRVACDGAAVAASQHLHAVVTGPFEEVLAQLRTQGAVLGDPVHWDGRHAIEFRSSWERAEVDLRNFHSSLQEVLAAARRVQGDILSAGGE